MSDPTLFISGGSGQLGRLVTDAVLSRGPSGRIIIGTRDPSRLKALEGVEVRQSDFTDKAMMVKALQGVDRFLIISTDAIGSRLSSHQTAIEAAQEAGVKELLYTSMPAPEPPSAITFAPEHYGTEQAVKASGLLYTILRMNWYAENLLGTLPQALASGQWYTSTAGGEASYVSRTDCARAAAGALLRPSENRTYTVTGPEALSNAAIAAITSALTGRPLSVVDVSDEALAAGARAAGVPEFVIEHFMVAFDRNTREGKVAAVTNAVEELWGEKPQGVRDVLAAHVQALLPSA